MTAIQENKLSLDKLKHASVLYFRSRDKAMFFSEPQESASKGVGLQKGFYCIDLLPQPVRYFSDDLLRTKIILSNLNDFSE